jgi:large subunit ribosomal protein L4
MVIDSFGIEEPKTARLSGVLEALGVGSSVLLVTADPDTNVVRSARNLVRVKTLPACMLNVLDLLSYKTLLMTVDAVRQVETVWGAEPVATGGEGA